MRVVLIALVLAVALGGCSDKGVDPQERVSFEVYIGLSAPQDQKVDLTFSSQVSEYDPAVAFKTVSMQTDGLVKKHTLTEVKTIAERTLWIEFPQKWQPYEPGDVWLPRGYEGPFYGGHSDFIHPNVLRFKITPEQPETYLILATKSDSGWTLVTGLEFESLPEGGFNSHEFLLDVAARFEQSGRLSEADQAYEALAWQYPERAREHIPERLYQRGEQQWEDGEFNKALEVLEQIVSEYPESPSAGPAHALLPELLLASGVAAQQAGSFQEALARIERVVRDYPESPSAGPAQALMPELLFESALQAQKDEAYQTSVESYGRIIDEYPDSPYRTRAEADIVTVVMANPEISFGEPVQALIPELLFESGLRDRQAGSNWSALRLFERIIESYPDSPFAEQARTLSPEILFDLGFEARESDRGTESERLRMAIGRFERILNEYPDSPFSEQARTIMPELMFELASTVQEYGVQARQEGEPEFVQVSLFNSAIEFYERIINEYPDSLYRDRAEEGIITAELLILLGGNPGELPPIESLNIPGSGDPEYCVENDTDLNMTVFLSGPTTVRITLEPREQQCLTVAAGHYQLAVRVDDPMVIPFVGEREFEQNYRYSSSFFIVTIPGKVVAGSVGHPDARGYIEIRAHLGQGE